MLNLALFWTHSFSFKHFLHNKKLVILAYVFFILITFIKHDLLNIYLTLNQKLFIASHLNTWKKMKQNKK